MVDILKQRRADYRIEIKRLDWTSGKPRVSQMSLISLYDGKETTEDLKKLIISCIISYNKKSRKG